MCMRRVTYGIGKPSRLVSTAALMELRSTEIRRGNSSLYSNGRHVEPLASGADEKPFKR